MDRKLLLPIALVVAWVIAMGYVAADLARFDGTMRAARSQALAERPETLAAPLRLGLRFG